MDTLRIVNCALEGLCLCICLILYIQTHLVKDKRSTDKWFKAALVSSVGMLLGDMSDWGLSGAHFSGAHILLTIGLTLFYAASGVVMFSFFAYIFFYLKEKHSQPEILIRILTVLSAAQIVLALISPFTGAIFTITEENIYIRGHFFWLSQALPAAVILMMLWVYIRTWNVMNKKERVYFSLYMLLPFISVVIQNRFYGMAAFPIALTFTFLIVNVFLHSEMDEQLRSSEQLREEEHIQALQELQENQVLLTKETITALSNTVEAKDRYTNGHSKRVAKYAREIAKRLGFSEPEQRRVYYAGMLHDVGKIRVPDTIINKTERLTDEEYAQIKLHTMVGYYILKEISSISDFAIGARWHHERFDGKGYPNGLSGENIPLVARIIGVADSYDAMTSNRSYRKIMSQEEVRNEIRRGSGTQFDPKIAEIMLDMIAEDRAYQMRQADLAKEWVILAIDDDAMVHKILSYMFRSVPYYKLITASSGEEGIDMLQKNAVDLVLLDVEMPDMNGFEVLHWIRDNRGSLPAIFMTGDKEIEIITKAEQLGINDYLSKPIVEHMLLESIQNVLLNSGIQS